MKKLMCLIALALVFSTSSPRTFAQLTPIIIKGGNAASPAQTSHNLPDYSPSFDAALTVQVILTLIQAGIIG